MLWGIKQAKGIEWSKWSGGPLWRAEITIEVYMPR